MFSIECIHIKMSIDIIYYSKNLVVRHSAKWKLWLEVEGSLYIFEKTWSSKKVFMENCYWQINKQGTLQVEVNVQYQIIIRSTLIASQMRLREASYKRERNHISCNIHICTLCMSIVHEHLKRSPMPFPIPS